MRTVGPGVANFVVTAENSPEGLTARIDKLIWTASGNSPVDGRPHGHTTMLAISTLTTVIFGSGGLSRGLPKFDWTVNRKYYPRALLKYIDGFLRCL